MKGQLSELLHRQAYLGLQRLRGRPVGPYIRQLQSWERLDRQAFGELTRARLAEALRYALERVPLYSSGAWSTAVSRADPDDLASWPVLERDVVRTRGRELHATHPPVGVFYRHSSKSTGEPLQVALDPPAAAWSWANEYRAMLWHGVGPGAKTLAMWGGRHPALDLVKNCATFDTRSLTTAHLDAATRFLLYRRPTVCMGLPSAVAQLARYVRARFPEAPKSLVPYAKLGGEQVYPFQREEIERHLGAKSVEFYGCTEVGAIAAECPRGSMHIFSEHVCIEILHNDEPAPAGTFGDLIATSLTNRAMPLVRCRIGDRGRISPDPCPCGLPHPVLTDLVGRASDVFLAADGTKVHGSVLGQGLKPLLAHAPPRAIRQVRFEQADPLHWSALIESGEGFDEGLAAELTDLIRTTFGASCEVEIRRVSYIPREPSGKFRYYRAPLAAHGDAAL
jgi:phenylacetate-CoA ligase